MSSNFTVDRICECCGNVFTAKTTVTRFCSKLCNKRFWKSQARGKKIAPMNELVEKIVGQTSEKNQPREFLTVRMAAKLLGVSEKIVYGMINTGRIRAVNLAERKTIVSRQEIDNLFQLPELPKPAEVQPGIEDCYHMAEAQAKFGISEKALYALVKRNKIQKFQSGWYTYVPKQALDTIFNPNH